MIIQDFQIPWLFHAWIFFLEIFQVFHDFQSLWEPCIIKQGNDYP